MLHQGWDTRSSPLQLGWLMSMVAFPSSAKGCSCFACCFFAESLTMHFPHTFLRMSLLTPSKASFSPFCILSLGYHRLSSSPARLTKQGASPLTTVPLWNPSWAAGGGGKEQAGWEREQPSLSFGSTDTWAVIIPEDVWALLAFFSACTFVFPLFVHLCFLCRNPQHVPVHIQKADTLLRGARWSKAKLLD